MKPVSKRLAECHAFIVVWDEFIALSQQINTMSPADEEYVGLRAQVEAAKRQVSVRRRAIGSVPRG